MNDRNIVYFFNNPCILFSVGLPLLVSRVVLLSRITKTCAQILTATEPPKSEPILCGSLAKTSSISLPIDSDRMFPPDAPQSLLASLPWPSLPFPCPLALAIPLLPPLCPLPLSLDQFFPLSISLSLSFPLSLPLPLPLIYCKIVLICGINIVISLQCVCTCINFCVIGLNISIHMTIRINCIWTNMSQS